MDKGQSCLYVRREEKLPNVDTPGTNRVTDGEAGPGGRPRRQPQEASPWTPSRGPFPPKRPRIKARAAIANTVCLPRLYFDVEQKFWVSLNSAPAANTSYSL